MPIDFIKGKVNGTELDVASRQQKQLSYFTESKVQDDISIDYIEAWSERKYRGDNYFLNFVKTVLKTDNFLLMYKYLRYPLPSARLIHDKIKAPLRRVFYSEDPYFKYIVRGENVNTPSFLNVDGFNESIFNALLFRYNDIVVVDLKDINTPFRSIISIDNVVSIDSVDSVINRIAYTATTEINGEKVYGVLYIDSEKYVFYSKDLAQEILNVPHDLGRCPADYISNDKFTESDVVRKGIFSYVREELEEYVFLKTLQRMAEASTVIPTVTMLDTAIASDDDGEGESDFEPMSANLIGGQKSAVRSELSPHKSVMESGNLIKVPLIRKEDGSVEMDVVTNYLNFFYIPVEAMNYLNDRLAFIKNSIISNVLGDYSEGSTPEGSKSDSEINKVTIVSKQDKLRDFARSLSRIRERSDYNMLALKYGKDNVDNEAFYGSDFFLETQESLYKLISESPNPIEVKSLLIKSARNRNRFNRDNFTREYILYNLLPYATRSDFELAVKEGKVGDVTFQYQTRFNHWISLFESKFGDILTFWESSNMSESEKILEIDNLIKIIIRDNYEESSTSKDLSRDGDS